jgi:3' terminal RNA ribose 2'-O-methyltransferase Hen1
MLLRITYTGPNAEDLGFLLHKNPQRPQVFDLGFGKAYVFYPEVAENRCTAALLLDIDPLDLARGKAVDGGAFDSGNSFPYVNDRPYVSSSFMSTAIAKVYGAALGGRCDRRPDLADTLLNLTAAVTQLPCDAAMLERVFAPLGYAVEATVDALDERYPDWGVSRCVDLTLQARVRLKDLLSHLYVLMPVFDRQKHYWVGEDEVDKLLRRGEGWLEGHPEKEFIVRRYLSRGRGLARMALARMEDGESGAIEEPEEEKPDAFSLNTRRLDAVLSVLRDSGARSVIDMGCGEGNLLRLLLKEKTFTRIAGFDVSPSVLERARRNLKIDLLPDAQKERITLFQSSLTYRDDRCAGYDAAAVVEVVEHIDPGRFPVFERVLFEYAKPGTVALTTPNVEYNEHYERFAKGRLRHGDHRFEWTREQFRTWCGSVSERYGYSVSYREIGDSDEQGAPTEMGVFTRCG